MVQAVSDRSCPKDRSIGDKIEKNYSITYD